MPCPKCQNERSHVLTQFNGKKSFIIATCTNCGFTVKRTGSESLIKFLLISGVR